MYCKSQDCLLAGRHLPCLVAPECSLTPPYLWYVTFQCYSCMDYLGPCWLFLVQAYDTWLLFATYPPFLLACSSLASDTSVRLLIYSGVLPAAFPVVWWWMEVGQVQQPYKQCRVTHMLCILHKCQFFPFFLSGLPSFYWSGHVEGHFFSVQKHNGFYSLWSHCRQMCLFDPLYAMMAWPFYFYFFLMFFFN